MKQKDNFKKRMIFLGALLLILIVAKTFLYFDGLTDAEYELQVPEKEIEIAEAGNLTSTEQAAQDIIDIFESWGGIFIIVTAGAMILGMFFRAFNTVRRSAI